MYLSHFNLHEKPFKISTDPKFLWLGEKQKKALETLRYGILYNDGYVVITGDVGTGKTTIATALVDFVSDKVVAAKIPYSDVDTFDFFRLISTAYGITDPFQSKGAFLQRFESFLRDTFLKGKKVVLIIDEAQRLNHGHLEELLYLSNVEENGTKLFNIVFVGQNEFNGVLLEESNRALRQRVAINHNLDPLTQDETRQYILHRLNVVQCKRELFTPEAIQDIFLLSQGIPRLINIICDLALLHTYFEGAQIVQQGTIQQCMDRLRLPGEKMKPVRIAEDHFLRPEGKVDNESDKKGFNEVGKRVRAERRTPPKSMTLFAVGCALIIILLGLALALFRNDRIRQSATHEGLKEQAKQGGAGTETTKEQSVSGVVPSAAKEQPYSQEVEADTDVFLKRKDLSRGQETKISKETNIQSEKTGGQKPIGRGASGGSAGQAINDALRQKTGLHLKEQGSYERGGASSEDRRGSVIENSRSVEESRSKDAEEIEPSKAIDWLLEKRSEKKTQE
jgi:type II secretory pathway predicted ATPase ExeA